MDASSTSTSNALGDWASRAGTGAIVVGAGLTAYAAWGPNARGSHQTTAALTTHQEPFGGASRGGARASSELSSWEVRQFTQVAATLNSDAEFTRAISRATAAGATTFQLPFRAPHLHMPQLDARRGSVVGVAMMAGGVMASIGGSVLSGKAHAQN